MKNTFITMERRLFFIIATLLISGRIDAQENHYQFNYHLFEHSMPIVTQIKIDGVEQTSSDIELGSFNGDIVTGSERIGQYGSAGYYRAYMAVFFNEPYEVSFKIYNHSTGEEMDNCEITYLGEPYHLVLNDDGLGTNRKPLVLNFLTTSTPTFTKEIAGYGNGNDKWYLIASPIDDVNPAEIDGMTAGTYDLYWFDQTQDLEWRNYKQGEGFNLVTGTGYLYANSQNTTLTFTGTPVEGDSYEVSLVKDNETQFPGWNLVGNPFTETAHIDHPFYIMNPDGSEIVASTESGIAPMEGIFVIAQEDGEILTFSTEASGKRYQQIVANVTRDRGIAIDRAIIRFGEDRMLPKFQIRDNNSKIYIPIYDQDYAMVRSENMGEMPLNFKAEENGIYSINVNAENMEMNYLHLIDNMTSVDVDLLETPCYSFEAKKTDYASRFKLVYSVSEDTGGGNETFAFISNGKLVVLNEGEATLQIIDTKGRIINSKDINGAIEINFDQAEGVYVIRLMNENNMKVQKIVVR